MSARGLATLLPRAWQRRGLLAWLLLPLAILYAAVVALRRILYAAGVLRAVRVGVPVIVVGNVTVGGAGKTPLVLWLAQALRARGYTPGVVSRGYGRSTDDVRAVGARDAAGEVGDEPLLIARRAGCPVFVGRDRVAAARALRAAHPEVDVLIADDGLQHYRLARDAEIVVFDARGAGNGFPLPAGPLREPVSRARRADVVVANGELPARLLMQLGATPRAQMTLAGRRILRLDAPGGEADIDALRGARVHAVAGIGNPQRFFDTLAALGIDCVPHAFADHHAYAPEDLRFDGAEAILMTEKDAVKCAPFASRLGVPCWALAVDAQLAPDILPWLDAKLTPRPETPHGPATA